MSCIHAIAAAPPPISPSPSLTPAHGVLFALSSPSTTSATTISTIGFRVDPTQLSNNLFEEDFDGKLSYVVSIFDGHYADPDRTGGGGGGLPVDASWDFRADDSKWTVVAEGKLDSGDLIAWPDSDDVGTTANDYFRIPTSNFATTTVGPGEGVTSFRISVAEVPALLNAPLESWEDFLDEWDVVYCGAVHTDDEKTYVGGTGGCIGGEAADLAGEDGPTLLIGEGATSYPFPTSPYFYRPAKFAGAIYYEGDCPSDPPSFEPTHTISPSKSKMPSASPTKVPTVRPSTSFAPSSTPSDSGQPTAKYHVVDEGTQRCHGQVTTDRDYATFREESRTSTSYGIAFPVTSDDEDDDGAWITSLGFYVDLVGGEDDSSSKISLVNCEVYALTTYGLYASADRNNWGEPTRHDHRGDSSLWRKVAEGKLAPSSEGSEYYFQIPFGEFEPTYVPPNGGIRSIYLTLDKAALVRGAEVNDGRLGKVQEDDGYDEHRQMVIDRPPTILIGEGVDGYPMFVPGAHFLYAPRTFVGRVVYERECPSAAPSRMPSGSPSESPSAIPSDWPSGMLSGVPSDGPSLEPSALPSYAPSLGPSEQPTSTPTMVPSTSTSPTHQHFPSASPTHSLRPSDVPSTHPSSSAVPSVSLMPSLQPSDRPSRGPRVSMPRPAAPGSSSASTSAAHSMLAMALIALLQVFHLFS